MNKRVHFVETWTHKRKTHRAPDCNSSYTKGLSSQFIADFLTRTIGSNALIRTSSQPKFIYQEVIGFFFIPPITKSNTRGFPAREALPSGDDTARFHWSLAGSKIGSSTFRNYKYNVFFKVVCN